MKAFFLKSFQALYWFTGFSRGPPKPGNIVKKDGKGPANQSMQQPGDRPVKPKLSSGFLR